MPRRSHTDNDPVDPQEPPKRSQRAGRGQGGAVAQLQKAAANIRPDLGKKQGDGRKRKLTEAMPDNLEENMMAPSKPGARKPAAKKGRNTRLENTGPLISSMPLNLTIPDTVPSRSTAKQSNSRFGFQVPITTGPPMPKAATTAQSRLKTAAVQVPPPLNGTAQERNQHSRRSTNKFAHPHARELAEVPGEADDEQSGSDAEKSARTGDEETDVNMSGNESPHADMGAAGADVEAHLSELNKGNTNSNDNDSSDDPGIEDQVRLSHPDNLEANVNQDGEIFDVLHGYRIKNRQTRPPTLEMLHVEGDEPEYDEGEAGSDEAEDEGEHGDKMNNKDTGYVQQVSGPKPTTLKYYGEARGWTNVLIRAKQRFALYTAITNGFPSRGANLGDAESILATAIADFEQGGADIDDAYNQTRHMNILVFQEAANFRSAMKKMARSIVRENYGDVLRTGDVDHNGEEVETCAGQLEEYEMVKKNVNEVLTGGRYLWGGKDKEGRTNNMGHKAIKKLCIAYYYSGPKSIAAFYPSKFSKQVPERAVIQNCLEEFSQEGYKQDTKFDGDRYGGTYDALLQLIEDVKKDPYHKAKWIKFREAWAAEGQRVLNPMTADRHNIRPVLD